MMCNTLLPFKEQGKLPLTRVLTNERNVRLQRITEQEVKYIRVSSLRKRCLV